MVKKQVKEEGIKVERVELEKDVDLESDEIDSKQIGIKPR